VTPSGPVRRWLRVTWRLGGPLAALGVPASAVTLAGVLVAFAGVVPAALSSDLAWLAGLCVLASGTLDGVDGAVAVLSGRATRWGAVLDSAADRVSELAFAAVLYALGAEPWWCLAALAATWLLEYLRARAAAVGMAGIGVVTVGERPTRVLVVALFCLGAPVVEAVAGAGTAAWVTGAAGSWAVLSLIGLGQLGVVVRRETLRR
jgi:CDP-diacylglycerol--glycerol-3-phosphate 3-phosphatidyltransferase